MAETYTNGIWVVKGGASDRVFRSAVVLPFKRVRQVVDGRCPDERPGLGASSLSQAIERAVEVGLLDASIYPPSRNLTQKE